MRGFIEQIHERVSGIDPDGTMFATGMGEAGIMLNGFLLEIDKMCFVEGLKGTLISLSCLAEQGWSITIAMTGGVNTATLTRDDDVLLEVPLCDGLYQLPSEPADQNFAIWQEDTDDNNDVLKALMAKRGNLRSHTHAGAVSDEELIHRRCAHVSWGNKRWARRLRRKYGDKLGRHHTMSSCEACMLSKMTRIISRNKPTRPATRAL